MNSTRRGTLAATLAGALLATTAVAADAKPPKRPDLVVSSLAVVAGAPHPGAQLKLADASANIGLGRAQKQSVTALYLSKDAKLDVFDTPLGARTLAKLRAGRISKGAVAVKLPKAAAAGSYRIFACADARRRLTERSELNNCRSIKLAISPVKPPGGKPGGGGPGGPPSGNGNGPLAYLTLYPPHVTLAVDQSVMTPTTVFAQDFGADVTYQVEGYDANGHDLGDFTDQTKFENPAGSCAGATCSTKTAGVQTVTGSVGTAQGTAEVEGWKSRVVCRGENYDIDGLDSNGCETAQPSPHHTTFATARSLGAATCNDNLSYNNFSGTILTDPHNHAYPLIDGFANRSAPEWYSVQALGSIGLACDNDYRMTIATSGGTSNQKCYRLSMKVHADSSAYQQPFYATYSVDVSGHGKGTVSDPGNAYDTGSRVFFEVERICDAPTREKVSYVVAYHL